MGKKKTETPAVIKQYLKVPVIAKMFGLDPDTVRNQCYARGQTFATRFKRNAHFLIEPDKYAKWLEGKQQQTREKGGYV